MYKEGSQLHACLSSQIMLLETARRYNHETQCITFLKDFTYSKDDFHRAGGIITGMGKMDKSKMGVGVG